MRELRRNDLAREDCYYALRPALGALEELRHSAFRSPFFCAAAMTKRINLPGLCEWLT